MLSMEGARIYDLDSHPSRVKEWFQLENMKAKGAKTKKDAEGEVNPCVLRSTKGAPKEHQRNTKGAPKEHQRNTKGALKEHQRNT